MKNGINAAQKIFGIIFLTVIIVYSAANVVMERGALAEAIEDDVLEESLEPKEALTTLDSILTEEMLGRNSLVEAYGRVQLCLGKNEDNAFDTVKDKAGFLYSGNFWNGFGADQKELAVRVRRLSDSLKKSGTKLGVVIYPENEPEEGEGFYGIPYSDYQEIAEDFMGWLRYYGVPLLDLTDMCEQVRLTHEEAFFKTDHHWTPRAAFEGYVRIVDFLNDEFQAELDKDNKLRDLASYEIRTFEGVMLGSKGRSTGVVWAGGTEDYTAIYPKEDGDYTLYWGDMDNQREIEGRFTKTLLNIKSLEEPQENIYGATAESAYLRSGVSVLTSIVNNDIENDSKILMIRDSYSTPVGAFLSQSFSRVDMVWNIEISEEELAELLEDNHYDYVLVAIYPTNLSEDAFPFGIEED